ncbi:MAG TPA: hypothetical protein VKV02_07855 [Acidobacteriaceae bacterium]|nr:hypothetical protein [Acidobacteriaceae bacterium]
MRDEQRETENRAERERLVGRIIQSGTFGDTIITREAVEGMVAQMSERALPTFIEHDPTNAPVGRTIGARLIELPDGEVAVEAVTEIFEEAVDAVVRSEGEFWAAVSRLPVPSVQDGPVELIIDHHSYEREDVLAATRSAAIAGEFYVRDTAVRFSAVPDALLEIALGPVAVAWTWFSKGFFTKLGERLGEEVGDDLADAYRRFKTSIRSLVGEKRMPLDTPPITMLTLTIERPDGGPVEVEGSTREAGDALEGFLDAGRDLAVVALAYLQLATEPGQIVRMHFRFTNGGWEFAYALDKEAERHYIAVASEEQYARILKEAEKDSRTARD